ncbi:menaquinone-dependent protoporphyrinogen IX dehydrogenase [Reinekea sp.]|jgi:menaquinone-dependent protoporphyrinogen oxidase|uniref:menaquinone-dependent protoporphyrinogen IX dehydrogenase n=1 Tax=Reinekea sp. TaxID=1970455 RepID=UPI0039899CB4
MTAIIFYSTTDGQTKKIAEKMADDWNGDVKVLTINELPNYVNDKSIGQVIVGASIRYGHYNKVVMELIHTHVDWLEAKNAAFFSVNLTARKPEKQDPANSAYIQRFIKSTGWMPNQIAMFAGRLCYPKYSFIDRQMIRLIMKMTGGCADGTSTIEYTNWDEVKRFSKTVSGLNVRSKAVKAA